MIFGFIIAVVTGLILGSFATAMIYRIPRGHPWAFALKKQGREKQGPDDISAYRSACTGCKTKLKFIDLIPVFSWLLTGGRCRYCKEEIGWRYPLTELGVVAGCVLIYLNFGFSPYAFFLIAAVPFLMALLVIDLEHFILPNALVLIVGAIGALYWLSAGFIFGTVTFGDIVLYQLGGALVFGAFAWFLGWLMGKILKKEALGFGDVKFFAVAGLWLGLPQLSWFCLFSGVFGVIFALVWQALKKQQVFPFGPALIAALFALLLFDGSLLP